MLLLADFFSPFSTLMCAMQNGIIPLTGGDSASLPFADVCSTWKPQSTHDLTLDHRADESLSTDGKLSPWRRLAAWLLVVAIALTCLFWAGSAAHHAICGLASSYARALNRAIDE